jgi:hypothetical protein
MNIIKKCDGLFEIVQKALQRASKTLSKMAPVDTYDISENALKMLIMSNIINQDYDITIESEKPLVLPGQTRKVYADIVLSTNDNGVPPNLQRKMIIELKSIRLKYALDQDNKSIISPDEKFYNYKTIIDPIINEYKQNPMEVLKKYRVKPFNKDIASSKNLWNSLGLNNTVPSKRSFSPVLTMLPHEQDDYLSQLAFYMVVQNQQMDMIQSLAGNIQQKKNPKDSYTNYVSGIDGDKNSLINVSTKDDTIVDTGIEGCVILSFGPCLYLAHLQKFKNFQKKDEYIENLYALADKTIQVKDQFAIELNNEPQEKASSSSLLDKNLFL